MAYAYTYADKNSVFDWYKVDLDYQNVSHTERESARKRFFNFFGIRTFDLSEMLNSNLYSN